MDDYLEEPLKGNQMIEINTSTPVETDQWRHLVSESSPRKLRKMNNIFYRICMVALIVSPLISFSIMVFADKLSGLNAFVWLFVCVVFTIPGVFIMRWLKLLVDTIAEMAISADSTEKQLRSFVTWKYSTYSEDNE
jgi:hypothetical protein